jgi:hypothetical protein
MTVALRAQLCCIGKPGAGNDRTDAIVFGIFGLLLVVAVIGTLVSWWWFRRRD